MQKECPHILTYGCIAHGIDLLCQDIWKIGFFTECIGQRKEIVKEIRNRHYLLRKTEGKKFTVALTLPVPTRWNSIIFLLIECESIKASLRSLAIHEDESVSFSQTNRRILLDDTFWSTVDILIKFLERIAFSRE